jgi:hypothetical protein
VGLVGSEMCIRDSYYIRRRCRFKTIPTYSKQIQTRSTHWR